MTENRLANMFLRTITNWFDKYPNDFKATQDKVWELAQQLAHIVELTKTKK